MIGTVYNQSSAQVDIAGRRWHRRPERGRAPIFVEKDTTQMGVSRIPTALRTQLSDEGTFGLIELLDSEKKDWSEDVLITATDRFERRLTQEVGLLRLDFQRSLQEGLGGIRTELANARVEMLRWSFAFWVGQVAAIAALLAFMLRATGH